MELTLELYVNPRPELDVGHLVWFNDNAHHITQAIAESVQVLGDTEAFVCGLEPEDEWPRSLKRWHKTLASWIPAQVFEWWMAQFETEPTLEPMPIGWWRWRTLAVVVARVGNEVAGIGALTIVEGGRGQGLGAFYYQQMCYEIRGVVVARHFRRNKLFSRVVEALLAEARRLGEHPTFLATRNPMLQKAIARQALTAPVMFYDAVWRNLACWCTPKVHPRCTECPERLENCLWWDTHLPLPSGETKDRFDYQDGPPILVVWEG